MILLQGELEVSGYPQKSTCLYSTCLYMYKPDAGKTEKSGPAVARVQSLLEESLPNWNAASTSISVP